uniref:Uncharacterized protein n=1 Tax=Anguilla anguilla TaxID=7936 RepID=A0A0E9VE44_ANGAN
MQDNVRTRRTCVLEKTKYAVFQRFPKFATLQVTTFVLLG